jgi:hypothetical protein
MASFSGPKLLWIASLVAAFLGSPLRAELRHHWTLDESEGLVAADSASGADGDLVNFELDDDAQWVEGEFNGAVDLATDGTFDNYITASVPALNGSADGFTMMMWLRPASVILNPGEYQLISTPGDAIGFTIMNNTFDGVLHDRVLLFWDGNLPSLHVGTTVLEPGEWYHVAITTEGTGGGKRYFVNGVEEAQRLLIPSQGGTEGNHPATTTGWAGGTISIGSINGPQRTHDSSIDDVRIYDTALSAAEILEIVENPPLPAPEIVDFVPAAGDVFHEAGDGLRFTARATNAAATIPTTGIQVVLNGTDVTAALTFTGTPAARIVIYEAEITVTDSAGGVGRRRHAFGTLEPVDEPGLIHHFRFDETNGLLAADLANGRNAALVNIADNGAQWTQGTVGGALALQRGFAEFEILPVDTFATGGYTVALWIKPGDQINSPGEYQILSTPNDAVGFTIMNALVDGILHDRVLLFWDGSLPNLHVGTTTLEPGVWFHVAITSAGPDGEKLYWVNGEPEEMRLFIPSQGGTEGFHPGNVTGWPEGVARIGAIGAGQRAHDSIIDDLRIYDIALEEDEIANLVPERPDTPPEIENVVPENNDNFHEAGDGFQFTARATAAGATIPTTGIRLTLNGVDVSGNLQISGAAGNRTVLYSDLVAETAYTATIDVTDSNGTQRRRTVVFGTLTASDDPNLIHHFRMDEKAGLVALDSARSANAILRNFEAVDNAQWIAGQVGGGLDLGSDATVNNYAEFTSEAISAGVNGGFTVAMWLRPGERLRTPGEYQLLATPGDAVGFTIMNTVIGGATHDRVLLFWDGSLPDLHVGTTTLEPGLWYHVAIVSEGPGGDKRYYVNGQPDEQRLYSPTAGGTQGNHPALSDGWGVGTAQIGAINGVRNHDSAIDDVRIYDVALSDEEMADLVGEPPAGPPEIQNLVPADGDAFHSAAAGFSFDVVIDRGDATLPIELITLSLNGTDVTASVVFSGTPQARTVRYSALEPERLYRAQISAEDSRGVKVERTVTFGTTTRVTEPGLRHYYKFDESTGLLAADSASGRTGSLFGFDLADDSQWVEGQVEGGLFFGGDLSPNNRVTAQLPALDGLETSGFTVAMWLNPGETIFTPGEYQLFDAPNDAIGFTIMNTTRGDVVHDRVLLFWDGNLNDLHVGTTPLEPGTWYHVAITSDPNSGEKLYWVNGELEEQVLFDPTLGGTEGVHPVTTSGWLAGAASLGALPAGARNHESVLDEVRIYEGALDADAIEALVSGGPPPGARFKRADADGSGTVNITDGIFILNFLFLGGTDPVCSDAADADDSGSVNITDGIFVLNFLFLGGADPAAPFPACGSDPQGAADGVSCDASHAGCI